MIDEPVIHRSALPAVGHASRLKMSTREKLLLIGHLLTLSLALEDEEVVAALAEQFGWGRAAVSVAEIAVSAVVLAVWALLTLAWVRCKREPAR